jgi:ArsR family transcriptional regulator
MEEPQLIRVAKALADRTRFRILRAIAESGELCCGDLSRKFPISQATVSHHLKILTEAGLIVARAEGQFHFFRAVPDALRDYRRTISDTIG